MIAGAVAQLQHQIALAERKAGAGQPQAVPARYPLAPDQLAHSLYTQRLAFDDELRNDPRWPGVGIDDLLVQRLRFAIAGKASDAELGDLVGAQIERFRAAGNTSAEPGSTEWREIARALCHAELEALARAAERDEGDFSGTPASPVISDAQPPADDPKPVSMKQLWNDYVTMRMQTGSMSDGGKQLGLAVEKLRKFVKHDDAARLKKKDVIAWRDHLLNVEKLSPRTVSDKYLSTVRSLLNWGVENDRLPENIAVTVKQAKPKKVLAREKGFTDAEALKILKASRSYVPHQDETGRVRETAHMTAAKRWVPILGAFTGTRVTEITQLRKEDIRQEGDQWVARLTPDAGTIKTGEYRDVPLHPQIITEGFADFVKNADPGPLFHHGIDAAQFKSKATQISNRLAEWLRDKELVPGVVRPTHAWRHRFKSQCIELDIPARIYDAIQGHSGKTASENYGDVSLKAKINAINKLPAYELSSEM
ncbi:tyrosine recombinase XerC [Phaeobacter inhibens]|uniref:Tyrosine recombinase XerC n=1 Tax=Phaeobacter inhibens TaxID=221822 RepID=A0ABM6RCI1_9RHOB|nr:tyrosine recombinase XerC [Phaeobacter inhibens]AUQ94112.1 tyrosine recombinase XerC [Phaeobacter inhibens]AUR19360.1 tyrosine recombinase XerC [Phaeobacter inhibens]